ncbi:DNA gyrase subunit A [Candidatus Woesearchaeota archaeon]|nr:DNA gyrase subunit A [Candidatus Woesearchaeota archaeon]
MPEETTPKPAASDKILPRLIEEEMKTAYVNYAMSVIVGRALPDVRDGLKPVHRRILYAMHEMGVTHNKPFKKCARIVGDTLGKYHPHGDMAVYDALVRMAQDFSLRYPLIKGQGNVGSVDGDSPAAMRYVEAKLNKLAEELLKDLDKETVDFRDNFDGSLKEPVVLPSKLPNLLINGSTGIAVGMATSIPPHNLTEVCNATIATIDNPEINVEELMQIIPGPDFPTGAEVICGPSLHYAYAKGKGKVTIKAIAEIKDDQIIITEIPYMINKAEMIEQIAELVKDKRMVGIRNINDESDREGIRVVIDLKKDVDPNFILNQLYEYSNLRVSFSIALLALVNNEPKVMGLKEFIQHHIAHRQEVITRRTQYELNEAQKKVHVLDGLLIALAHLDEVIPGIRNSRTVEDAQNFLINTLSLTEIQAKAILELRLQKLASLEQEKIKEEHSSLLEKITYYQSILASTQKVLELIKEELNEIKADYGDARRSKIVPGNDDEYIDWETLIEEERVIVTMTNSGYVKRLPLDTYRTQKRGGKGMKATEMKEEDFVEKVYVASTHDYLLIFTDKGQLYWLKVYNIPEGSRQAKGKHIANVLEMEQGEKITAIVPVRSFTEGYLFMATKQGTVKKTELKEFSNPRKGGIRAINLDETDTLVGVKYTTGNNEIILATKRGLANRFNEGDVRSMGRTAGGVRGIRLRKGDEVIGMLAADEGKEILTLTEKGYGKRTPVSEYRLCARGGKGVTNIKITDKNGVVKVVMLVDGSEDLMVMSKNGIAIRMKCTDISVVGRATQGVRVIKLSESDQLVAAAQMIGEENGNGGENVTENNTGNNNGTIRNG